MQAIPGVVPHSSPLCCQHLSPDRIALLHTHERVRPGLTLYQKEAPQTAPMIVGRRIGGGGAGGYVLPASLVRYQS
jgi:hypothetical protein